MPEVSVVLPVLIREEWQLHMTECAVATMRCTTNIPFELIVVESGSEHFETERAAIRGNNYPDRWFGLPYRGTPNADANRGVAAAKGDFVVYTGNDVFTRPGWLESLLQCFEIADCGIATLASADLKHGQADVIMEGVYGPFMMFRRGWSFDADGFPCQFGDTDLVMRVYEAGQRSYRNHRCVIQHLNRQTLSGADNDADFKAARQRFMEKHGGSHLLMYRILTEGWVV